MNKYNNQPQKKFYPTLFCQMKYTNKDRVHSMHRSDKKSTKYFSEKVWRGDNLKDQGVGKAW